MAFSYLERLVILLVVAGASACSNSGPLSLPTPVPSPTATTATAVPSPTLASLPPTATPFAIPSPTFALAPTGVPRLSPTVVEVARGFGGPDDVAIARDGSILFSDTANGTVNRIGPDGKVTTLVQGLSEPEGIVVMPDGPLIIAEQNKNRLLRFQPSAGQPPALWLQLENKTGQAGVDGIARDAKTGDIIVPDSPNGRVLRVSPDGKTVRIVAAGFVRLTGADVEADGNIVVADEFGDAVDRIHANGKVETLGKFATPDDVAVDSKGNIYVASLGDGSIRVIDPRTGGISLLVTLRGPQGLAVEGNGDLVATEPGLNRIVRVQIR